MSILVDAEVPLYKRRVIFICLTDRTLNCDANVGGNSHIITGRMPDDPFLEPCFGLSIVAFANDIYLIVVTKTIDDIKFNGVI